MSSGRDEMMSNWSQEQKKEVYQQKTPIERMEDYLKTLEEEVERIKWHIKELKNETKA